MPRGCAPAAIAFSPIDGCATLTLHPAEAGPTSMLVVELPVAIETDFVAADTNWAERLLLCDALEGGTVIENARLP
jgi:hypothetical protein